MRKIFLLILLFAYGLQGWTQHFSGDVYYAVKIIPKHKNLNVDSILDLQPGTTSLYSITNGYYKSTYFKEGKFTYSYTYHNDTQRMYDEEAGNEYITFRDSRKGNNYRIRSIVYRDSIKVIQGYKCFMVERVYEGYIAKTYYALDLRINPDSFMDHAVGDWYNQIKEVNGALSLGSVNEYATHFEMNEVTKVTPRPLSLSDFTLPDKLTVASESALDKAVSLAPLTKEVVDCYRQKMLSAMNGLRIDNLRIYIILIVSETGAIDFMEPYEEDEYSLHNTAMDILQNCGIKFMPGEIGGKPVKTLIYFPVDLSQ